MTASTKEDAKLKCSLLDDTFTIVDMEGIHFTRLTGLEEQVGGYDMVYKGVPVSLPSNSLFKTFLGCHNNRREQIKKLAKSTSIRLAQEYEDRKKNGNGKQGYNGGYYGYNNKRSRQTAMYKGFRGSVTSQSRNSKYSKQKKNSNKYNNMDEEEKYDDESSSQQKSKKSVKKKGLKSKVKNKSRRVQTSYNTRKLKSIQTKMDYKS